MREILAKITVDSRKRQIRDVSLLQKNFRFKCKRCATFCCRLGGPPLTRKDIEKLMQAGYPMNNILEPAKREFKGLPLLNAHAHLRNRKDGSCIFLKFDAEEKRYECSIYDCRPTLCRLYPFEFDKISSKIVLLKVIPCCRGLNNPNGESVNEKSINNHLLASLYEALDLFPM